MKRPSLTFLHASLIACAWLNAISILSLLSSTVVAAETYLEWVEKTQQTEILGVSFHNFPSGSRINLDSKHIPAINLSDKFTLPGKAYLGDLIIQTDDRIVDLFPLTVRLLFSPVFSSPYNIGHAHRFSERDNMAVSEELAATPPVKTSSYSLVNGNQDFRLPLIIPSIKDKKTHQNVEVISRLEILDKNERILGRWVLVKSRDLTNNSAWVINDPEGDRFLREYAGAQSITSVSQLPTFDEAYTQVDAIWISQQYLDNNDLLAKSLRRKILMGTWLYGHPEVATELAKITGLRHPQGIFFGGIGASDKISPQIFIPHPTRHEFNEMFTFNKSAQKYVSDSTPLNRYKEKHLRWTYCILGAYFVLLLVGTPLLFHRTSLSQRWHIWWILPVLTLFFSLTAWFGGRAYLSRTPLLHISEYRYGYGSWPEIFVTSKLQSITFEKEVISLQLPSSAIFSAFPEKLNETSATRVSHLHPDETELSWNTHGRGGLTTRQISYFLPMEHPVELTSSKREVTRLIAKKNIKRGFILHKGKWKVFGPIAEGMSLAPEGFKDIGQIDGLPSNLNELFITSFHFPTLFRNSVDLKAEIIQQKRELKEAISKHGLFPDDVIVLAVTDELPGTRALQGELQTSTEVIWVLQLPIQVEETRDHELN